VLRSVLARRRCRLPGSEKSLEPVEQSVGAIEKLGLTLLQSARVSVDLGSFLHLPREHVVIRRLLPCLLFHQSICFGLLAGRLVELPLISARVPEEAHLTAAASPNATSRPATIRCGCGSPSWLQKGDAVIDFGEGWSVDGDRMFHSCRPGVRSLLDRRVSCCECGARIPRLIKRFRRMTEPKPAIAERGH